MKKALSTILFLTFCLSALYAQPNVSKEEYAVYAAILKSIYAENLKDDNLKTSFVILDETFKPDFFDKWQADKFKGLSNDFKRKNQQSVNLKEQLPVKYSYSLLKKIELEKILEKGQVEAEKTKRDFEEKNKGKIRLITCDLPWKYFYESYPKSDGYNNFSRAGFSYNRKFAMVDVKREARCGGSYSTYILKKVGRNWKIYTSYGSGWVS